jgi:serine/threonine protein kinase/tetratricopeptide (TPR) repeat protein
VSAPNLPLPGIFSGGEAPPEGFQLPLQTISHYELLEPIGRGGMGVVHKARDLKLGRLAALKFLSAELLPRSDAHARFLQEARSLSSLSHPHVATVYEVDEVDGKLFLAMEYLSGGTLRAKVAAATAAGTFIPEEQLLDWGIGLAEGLAHVHARGIVHRDIKSSNAMFDEEGRIKLTDFGLAKVLSSVDESMSSGVVGTIQYMSPEQFRGGPVDHRSDLFSLGIVLYETATGRLPFSGATPMEVANKILAVEAPSLSEVRSGVPPGFHRIVARLLSKLPGDRYQSAQQVRQDLSRVKSGELDPSAFPTTTLRLPRATRRLQIPLIAAVAVIALIAVAKLLSARAPAPPVADASAKLLPASASPLPEYKHVLVLPLQSIGGDANQAALCDGLTETMTAALTQSGLLSVVPARDASKMETVEQARQKFGVNLVVSGSLQRRGERIRLTLNLVDAEKARQLGVETVEGPAVQPFQIEDGMFAKLADLLDVAVPRKDTELLAKQALSAPKAFDAYLRGRGFLYRYDKTPNLDRAAQQFEAAIQVDPDFALAYVGLAEALLARFRQENEKSTLSAAHEAVKRALELSPDLAAAHSILGAVLAESDQPNEAARELERAIEVDPKDPAAYRELAWVYQTLGQLERTEQVFKKAIQARPGDWRGYSNLAVFYYQQRRYEDAEGRFRKVIQIAPDNHYGYLNLGGVLTEVGRNDEAEEMFLKAKSLQPTATVWSNLGVFYMLTEQYEKAVPVLETATQLASQTGSNDYAIWGNLGDAYWLSGAPADKSRTAYLRAVELAEHTTAGTVSPAERSSFLAEYFAKIGDGARARERISSALESGAESALVHYEVGIAYAMLGDQDRSLEELKAALVRGFAVDRLRTAPELKTIRARSDFARLLEFARPNP